MSIHISKLQMSKIGGMGKYLAENYEGVGTTIIIVCLHT